MSQFQEVLGRIWSIFFDIRYKFLAVSTEVTSLQQSRDDNNVSKIADTGEKMYFVVFKAKFCGVYDGK